MNWNKVHCKKWEEGAYLLPEKCAGLIIADPPYFEVKGEFDFVWKSFDDYLADVEKWAKACKHVLADNGTLFVYGHAKKIAYVQCIFDKYFNLENNITWWVYDRQTNKGVESFRCFAPVTERILMYSNELGKTGLQEIYEDDNCFEEIKSYLKNEKIKSGLTSKNLNLLFSEYTNKVGCRDRSVLEHYWQKSQWVFPTKEIYENVLQPTGFWQKPYEALRQEYEALRQEYEALRRPFNNYLKLTDVLKFSQEGHITGQYDHETIKPEKLTRALILTCSRKDDLVVVPFAGSGTECAMAAKEGRKFIGYDTNQKHVNTSNKRFKEVAAQKVLF